MAQLLFFSVDDVHGAIPLADTSRVIRMVMPAEKPGALPWEAGTINLHGKEITVISMRSLLGLAASQPRLTDMLIIASSGRGDVALWVDTTSGVQDIPLFSDSADTLGPIQPEIPGVWQTSEGLQVIYDLTQLIATGGKTLYRPGYPRSLEIPEIVSDASGGYSYDSIGVDTAQAASLLRERAKKIARPEEGSQESAVTEVLRFRLAYREYAIDMQHIREVVLTGKITPVPGTPDYISGICMVRGEIISLVDLRVLLSIPEKGLTDLNRVIVLSDNKFSFGILADHITGIGMVELDRISPEYTDAIPVKSNYVRGVAEGSLIVLDTVAMFADPKMIIEDT
ncbi:chemotaxis protein CheW [Methanoregula sp.]|uniref:chemotaxis protein CheW n=1 Tax=Methanoregula sp. TaxID=2052170 RepID=UPI00236EEE29|nr:chemotaxis protein CheW [Methanoregula sp.]MDD1687569.1 chemotaxis protein CheW [Methanoregula sp.]